MNKMNWKGGLKFLWLCGVPLMLIPILLSCITPAPEGKKSIEVTDDLGRVVKISETPQGIISLAPSNTEILFALGLGERVVGVTEYCSYPPEAREREKVGGFSNPDIEKIIALEPDLILATSIHEKEIIPALEERGLTVFALSPKNLDGILRGLQNVGKITGKEDKSAELVGQMKKRIAKVADKVQGLGRPRVFYMTWHDPLWTAGSGTIANDVIAKAGGQNIFQDITGYKTVDLETVIGRNPQVIIACTGHGEAKDKPFNWAKEESRLAETEARKNNQVYQIEADLITRPGPRIIDGLEKFAHFIHPEVFAKE